MVRLPKSIANSLATTGLKYWVNPFSTRQSILLRLSILAWVVAVTLFVIWWVQPQHHISMLGSVVGSLIILFEIIAPAYFFNFIRRIKVVNPELQPDPAWRLAIVVTRAPSEPWDVVEKTLYAMLNQDIPHDTWLADEQPTPDIVSWCETHGVHLSTRHGVEEYHRAEWPKRTRCKEGNLAYFYDHFGYADYDFVAQLDADHVPTPSYLREMVKPFVDSKVGYVAAPSICDANAAQSWSARGRLYAEANLQGPMQCGSNEKWAPLCFGSHYCVRTAALRQIGGLGPELAEDHSTSLMMNAAGWNGVFQPYAIAHGDGPASFPDCMIQEFQWSRSLTVIMLKYTPSLLKNLSARKRFQFIFSQAWYSLFSSIAIVGFSIPIICLMLDNPLLRVTYLDFLVFSLLVGLISMLPSFLLKQYRFLRPVDAKLFSWEYPLFTLSRFPWVFAGVVNAFVSVISSRQLDFKVTPKGSEERQALPTRVLTPYIFISLASSLVVLLLNNRSFSAGYYFLALITAGWMWVSAFLITWLHYQEGAKSKVSKVIKSTFWLLVSLVILILAAASKVKYAATYTFAYYNQGVSSVLFQSLGGQNRLRPITRKGAVISKSSCKPSPCFGYHDYTGTLVKESVPAAINLSFIPWGNNHTQKITKALTTSSRVGSFPVITLEFWPWAILDTGDLKTYKAREKKANQSLLKDIISGIYDEHLLVSLKTISEESGTVVAVRIMHEMEATKQYPWYTEDPILYKAAFRHVVKLAQKNQLNNLEWMWSPVGYNQAADYWPGGDVVDYIGLSIYATPEWNGGLASKGQNLPLDLLLKPRYWVRKYNKPIVLAEVGVNDTPERQMKWLKQAFDDLLYYPEIVGWVYFNQQQPAVITLDFGLPDWSLSQDQARELKLFLASFNSNGI